MTAKKWQILEGVVTAIERSLTSVPGTLVVPNAMVPVKGTVERRQVDVLVEIPAGERRLRIAIEVRDKSQKLDVTQIEQLAAKLAKLDVDRGSVVALRGFTDQARIDARRYGIELRTLAEIEAPAWWLPSAMTMEKHIIHLLATQLNYDSEGEDIQARIRNCDNSQLLLVEPPHFQGRLTEFVASQGLVAIREQEFADGEEFTVTLKLELPTGSHLLCSGIKLPLPNTILAWFQMKRGVEAVSLRPFAFGDRVNAFSGVSQSDGQQLTLVTQEHDDGSRSIAISVADARPTRTKVAPITGGTSQET